MNGTSVHVSVTMARERGVPHKAPYSKYLGEWPAIRTAEGLSGAVLAAIFRHRIGDAEEGFEIGRFGTPQVSERLGHASVGITLDAYSHMLPNLQE